MGNTCGCTEDRKAGDAGQGNISQPVKKIAPNAFVQPTVQSKFTPASFSQLPPGDKDQLLADVFKLIALNGDLSRVKSTNAHVKTLLSKSSAKFIHESRDQYDGEVVEGLASGKGKAIYASDASTYEGNFLAGYEFGEGTVKHPNGDVDHCQTFNRGLQHGICHKISKDKACSFQKYDLHKLLNSFGGVADHDLQVHAAARAAVQGLVLFGRPVVVLHAQDAARARHLLLQEDDLAVLLLDALLGGAASGGGHPAAGVEASRLGGRCGGGARRAHWRNHLGAQPPRGQARGGLSAPVVRTRVVVLD